MPSTRDRQACPCGDSSPLFIGQHLHLVVAVEHDFAVLLIYKLAVRPRASEGLEDGSVVLVVVLAQNGFDSLGGLLGVVEGHLREEMVDNVSVTDVVVQNVVDTVVAIDGTQCSAHKSECLWSVVRDGRVRVLQVGDEDEPAVDNHVGNEVVLEDGGKPKDVDRVQQGGEGREETEVGDNDVPVLAIGEHGGAGVEMVGALSVGLA